MTEQELWDALTERHFDPAHQEVIVTEAAMAGEFWAYSEIGDGQHVHVAYDEAGDAYTLTDAGPGCKLPHD